MVSPLVHFHHNKKSGVGGGGGMIESLFASDDSDDDDDHRSLIGGSHKTIHHSHSPDTNHKSTTTFATTIGSGHPTLYTNHHDHEDSDESSSSESSSDDDDVLSDTECTADSIRRKYTQTTHNIGQYHHSRDNHKDDDIDATTMHHDTTTPTTTTSTRNSKRTDRHNRSINKQQQQQQQQNVNRTIPTWTKISRNIELKLYHQFHFRDQIFNHLLMSVQQPAPPPKYAPPSTAHSTNTHSTANTYYLYLQTILDREYQVRYCQVDRIMDRMQQKLHNQYLQRNNHHQTSNTQIDKQCTNVTPQQLLQNNQRIEELRQRLYRMIQIMKQSYRLQEERNDVTSDTLSGGSCHDDDDDDDDITTTKNDTHQCRTLDVPTLPTVPDPVTSVSLWNAWWSIVVPSINIVILERDDALFLQHLFLPAVFSLFVHCMIHTSLYDGTMAILEVLKSFMMSQCHYFLVLFQQGNADTHQSILTTIFHSEEDSVFSLLFADSIWTMLVFTFGATLLRCTGDIFWWSSHSNYRLLKFDFQNRRLLLQSVSHPPRREQRHVSNNSNNSNNKNTNDENHDTIENDDTSRTIHTCTMTQLTMWIRQRNVLRATFFMFGYTCCYIASHDFIRYMTLFVHYCTNAVMTHDWNHHLLSHLPSIVEMTTNGTCSDRYTNESSFCSSTCQNEMEYRADRFLQLKLDDMEYTRTVFSPYSHEQYWNYWIHNVDLTKVEHSYFPGSVVLQYLAANLTSRHGDGPPPMEHLLFHNDLPLLFSKHEQILYCCVVILSSIGILYVLGVKIWEKY